MDTERSLKVQFSVKPWASKFFSEGKNRAILDGVVTGDQSHLVCSGMPFEFSNVVRSTHQEKIKRVKNMPALSWGMHGVFTKMLDIKSIYINLSNTLHFHCCEC